MAEEQVPAAGGAATSKAKRQTGAGSYFDKVCEAIRQLKSPSGSSVKAIVKVLAEQGHTNENAIKKALKNGVEDGGLVQNKASYSIAGEAYEDTSEKVSIEEPRVGSGEPVQAGNTVSISYKGTLAATGARFDSGKLTFTVKAGEVVKGMDAAVLGMRPGGRRIATIPPSLGYGKRGSKPDIPPDATLVFDITLYGVK